MLISSIILVLVLTAAVAGLIWFVHREAHRDCSCGCGGCSLARNCKRAALCVVALLVALTSSGINIEHHCHHDEECAKACTCGGSSCDPADPTHPCDPADSTHSCGHADPTHPCEHATPSCDHCAECWFLHLDLDQYDQPSGLRLPDPEQMNLLFALVPALLTSSTLYPASCAVHHSSSLAPPREGRHILSSVCKLTI